MVGFGTIGANVEPVAEKTGGPRAGLPGGEVVSGCE